MISALPEGNKLIFVVVPAYNEGKVLKSTLNPLIKAGYSIVVVDDGSQDNTSQILEGLDVYYLKHPFNLGQGAALQTGVDFSLQMNAEVIVHFDADGQHRVEDIESLVEPLRKGEADVVLGSRFLRKSDESCVPWPRRYLLKIARIVNGVLTGVWLSDAHNGFRAMSCKAASKIILKENGYAHASEFLSEVRRHQLSYMERPTEICYTEYSRSKGQPMSNAFGILLDLIFRKVFRR